MNRMHDAGFRWMCASWILLLVLLTGCGQELPAIANGTPAPAFTLTRLDGVNVRFPEQYQGQVIALRFWADWCPYCHGEMTALEPVYRQYRDRGLTILAVNVMQPPETVQKFVNGIGASYEILLDRDGAVMRRYQVIGLPVTYLIDRQGLVRARIIGESTPDVFIQAISPLL
jgi:peroxiredoxin